MQLGIGQAGTGQQILMHADGSLHLSPAPQYIATRNVGIKGFSIDLKRSGESVNRVVLPPIQ